MNIKVAAFTLSEKSSNMCVFAQGLEVMFLSDFRPREEYYVLLNDESSTIKRFGKNAQIEYKNMTFLWISLVKIFIFFFIFHFFRVFLDRFEEKVPKHQKK